MTTEEYALVAAGLASLEAQLIRLSASLATAIEAES